MRLVSFLLAVLCTVAAAVSQSRFMVGQKDVAWHNPTAAGTPLLYTRVLYPSPVGGVDAPLEPRAGGWPTIVFLHGFGLMGRDYATLASTWASQGFAVVLVDSAMFDFFVEAADGIAQFTAIQRANEATGTFFHGAFDMERVGIAGHSMGGGAMALVLASNPGYRCGFAIATVFPGQAPTAQVHVPLGCVVGTGDVVTPWYWHTHPYYNTAQPQTGLKFLYLLDGTCDHMNVAGLAAPTSPALRRTLSLSLGFFRHFLGLDANALENCIGPAALAEPHLQDLTYQVAEPRLWAAGRLVPGRSVRISLVAEAGPVGILAAPTSGWSIPTSIGTLQLDPSAVFTWVVGVAQRDRRIDASLTVPNNPNLVGVTIALQGVGATNALPILLGSAAQFVVQ